jgi:hypothetical protein
MLTPSETARLNGEYEARLTRAESQVVREVIATGDAGMHRPEPFSAERGGTGSRLLDEVPSGEAEYWRYGLDARGNVVVARYFYTPDTFVSESFVRHGATEIELVQYDSDHRAVEVGRARVSGDQIQAWHGRSADSVTEESYEWRDDRLGLITSRYTRMLGTGLVEMRSSYRPQFDAAGELAALIEEEPGQPARVVYSRKRRRRRLTARDRARLDDLLVERLERYVREHGEASFCLALMYDPVEPLPPSPILGPAGFAQAHAGEPAVVWNPAEWPGFDSLLHEGERFLDEPDIAAAIARATDALATDEGLGVVILNAVAKRLNEALADVRPGVVPRFVVYPSDPAGADLVANFAAITTPEIRSELEAIELFPAGD